MTERKAREGTQRGHWLPSEQERPSATAARPLQGVFLATSSPAMTHSDIHILKKAEATHLGSGCPCPASQAAPQLSPPESSHHHSSPHTQGVGSAPLSLVTARSGLVTSPTPFSDHLGRSSCPLEATSCSAPNTQEHWPPAKPPHHLHDWAPTLSPSSRYHHAYSTC